MLFLISEERGKGPSTLERDGRPRVVLDPEGVLGEKLPASLQLREDAAFGACVKIPRSTSCGPERALKLFKSRF